MKSVRIIASFFLVLTALIYSGYLYSQNPTFSGGSGTQSNPWQITTRFDLDTLAHYVNNGNNWSAGKHFKLMTNITNAFSGIIGWYSALSDSNKFFRGHFDGNGKTITLAINQSTSHNIGLFGGFAGTVTNLTVTGNVFGGSRIGGIVGRLFAGGSVLNCHNKANVVSSMSVVGGVIGFADIGSYISNCTNSSNLTSWDSYVGGIVGYAISSTILNCYNFGNIFGVISVGGIIGENNAGSLVENCINTGNISGTRDVGGITGINRGFINLSVNLGSVSGADNVGGITGFNNGAASPPEHALVSNSINGGIVTSPGKVGGIAGTQLITWNTITENEIPKLIIVKETIISNCLNVNVVLGSNPSTTGAILGECCFQLDSPTTSPIICHDNVPVTVQTGFPPVIYTFTLNYSNHIINCYYDKQLSLFGGIANEDLDNAAEGKFTLEMINSELSVLGADWIFSTNGIYPIPSGLQNHNVGRVAASPAIFNAADIYNNLRKNFNVSRANNVGWLAKFNKVKIVDTNATITGLHGDTLIASIGDIRKTIPIDIKFIPAEFTVRAFAVPSPGGVITVINGEDSEEGNDVAVSFNANDTARVTAVANPYYTFINWEELPTGNVFSTNPNVTVVVNRNMTFQANFVIDSFLLKTQSKIVDAGNVAEAGAAWGGGWFDYGTTTSITAEPYHGYHFVKWIDDHTGELYSDKLSTTVEMTRARSFTAIFDIDTFNVVLSVEPPTLGATTGAGRYIYKTDVPITVQGFDTCYKFVHWTSKGAVVSTDPNFNLTLLRDTNLVAHFTAKTYQVKLKTDPPDVGITTGGGTFGCIPQATTIKVTQTNPEYKFVNWTDDETGESISFTTQFHWQVASKDYSFTANFISDSIEMYIVELIANPTEGGSLSGGGAFFPDAQTTINANPNESKGYRFVSWTSTSTNAVVSNNPNFIHTVGQDTSFTANFSNDYNITITVNPSFMGTLDGDGTGTYPYGDIINVTAISNDTNLYKFVSWTSGTDTLSKEATYTFTVTENKSIVANFELIDAILDDEIARSLSVFPNPTEDYFTISFDVDFPKEVKITLNDLSGREIFLINDGYIAAGSFSRTVNTETLAKGTYYLNITIDENSKIEKIIVK